MFRKVNADGDIAVIVVNADIADNGRPRSPCRRFVFSAVGNDGDVGVVGVCLHSKRLTSTLGGVIQTLHLRSLASGTGKLVQGPGRKAVPGKAAVSVGFPEASR